MRQFKNAFFINVGPKYAHLKKLNQFPFEVVIAWVL